MAASSQSSAPAYRVPTESLISIEHPCIVHNFDKGFKSLGGEPQIKHLFEGNAGKDEDDEQNQRILGVSLRPNDPFAQKISSQPVKTDNVLLKITLPKRTGRKRKRGSDDPFVESSSETASPTIPPHDISAPDLLRRLSDNANNYTVAPIGTIASTHRFRTLPDLQMRASELPIMREIRDHAMTSSNYDTFKKFSINLKPSSRANIDAGNQEQEPITAFPAPPLFFTPGSQPYQYGYRQHVEPEKTKYSSLRYPSDPNKPVPQAPPSNLPELSQKYAKCLPQLRELLEKRPIATMTVVKFDFPDLPKNQLESALCRLAYFADEGPWRGCWIKFGVDPRKDRKYREFQTVHFLPRQAPPPAGYNPQQGESSSLQQEQQGAGGEAESARNSEQRQSPTKASPTKKPPKLKSKAAPGRKTRKRNVREDYRFSGGQGGTIPTTNTQTVFQLCDLSSCPILPDIVRTDSLREECDSTGWGWYWNGSLAKVRVLMRDMLVRIAARPWSSAHAGDGGKRADEEGSGQRDDQGEGSQQKTEDPIITPEMALVAQHLPDRVDDVERDVRLPPHINWPEDVDADEVERLVDEVRKVLRMAARRAKRGDADFIRDGRGGVPTRRMVVRGEGRNGGVSFTERQMGHTSKKRRGWGLRAERSAQVGAALAVEDEDENPNAEGEVEGQVEGDLGADAQEGEDEDDDEAELESQIVDDEDQVDDDEESAD